MALKPHFNVGQIPINMRWTGRQSEGKKMLPKKSLTNQLKAAKFFQDFLSS